MNNKKTTPIIILGYGGTCRDILDTIFEINSSVGWSRYECIGFLDDDLNLRNLDFGGIKVIGGLRNAINFDNNVQFVNGLGSPSNYKKIQSIFQGLQLPIERFETLIHPSAIVSKYSYLGKGTVIFANTTICTNVNIGAHVKVLSNTVINHDCSIEDYTIIASGVCLSGNVNIGASAYVGSCSSVKENLRIGGESLIGMGSVVINDIPNNTKVAGNPARVINKL